MKFCKMNGAGNDFIIVNNMDGRISHADMPRIAKTLCERHLSIGADGFMVVEASDKADYKMLFFNSDGSMGEMCGNGARCIARYGYENKLAGDTQKIETTAGIVIGERIDKRNYKIRLNDPCNMKLDIDMEVCSEKLKVSYLELGNPGIPHAVVEIKGLKDYDESKLFDIGRALRYDKNFEKGANINFYDIIGKDHILEKTYERGVEDFTYACGTGTGSMVTILEKKGLVSGKNVNVDVPGGRLIIDIVKDGDKVKDLYLTGPTNIVCIGEVRDEELNLS